MIRVKGNQNQHVESILEQTETPRYLGTDKTRKSVCASRRSILNSWQRVDRTPKMAKRSSFRVSDISLDADEI
jgi:hypothetical protein